MTKKRILLLVVLLMSVFIIRQVYIFGFTSNDNLQSIYLVPKDAIYILETGKPIDSWTEVSNSEIWTHLLHNEYFKELTKSLNSLDTIFKQQKSVFDFVGNREVLISAHIYKPKDYGLLYIIDLQKFSKLNILKNNISKLINDDYKVNKRKYHEHEIIEVYDTKKRETLSITFIKNQMVVSYIYSLVEAAIDQYNEPYIGRNFNFIEIYKKVGTSDLFQFYVQYDYIDEYSKVYINKPNQIINEISKSLLFSGFDLDLNKNHIKAKGFTNVNETTSTYLKALQKSGKGNRTIAKVAPISTSFYLSFAFDSFTEFYKNFETIQKSDSDKYLDFIEKKETVENFLKIDFKDHFFKWIDNEIALIHLESNISKSNTDIAVVLKTNNIKDAKENLDFIINQIKKRTPVKFKQINYKKHEIHFLDVKGFFKIILGNMLEEIEKPYFTIIDEFVVFSNSPNTLKQIITSYTEKQTLNSSKEFNEFNEKFDSKSSVFSYINTPIMYNSLYTLSNNDTKIKLKKNKDYIVCFSQVGFQLMPKNNIFESNLIVKFEKPKTTNNSQTPTTTQNKNILKKGTVPSANDNQKPRDIEETIFNIPEINPTNLSKKDFTINYTSGQKHKYIKLKNGLKHGDYKEYFKNGKVRISGKYRKGKQVGVWKAYTEKGELIIRKRL